MRGLPAYIGIASKTQRQYKTLSSYVLNLTEFIRVRDPTIHSFQTIYLRASIINLASFSGIGLLRFAGVPTRYASGLFLFSIKLSFGTNFRKSATPIFIGSIFTLYGYLTVLSLISSGHKGLSSRYHVETTRYAPTNLPPYFLESFFLT